MANQQRALGLCHSTLVIVNLKEGALRNKVGIHLSETLNLNPFQTLLDLGSGVTGLGFRVSVLGLA